MPTTTKLHYEITPDRERLYTTVDELNPSTAALTVTAQNKTAQPVAIKQILVELKKVVNGADTVQLLLNGSEGGIGFPKSFTGPGASAWSVTANDGQFTLKSRDSVTFKPGDKVSLVLTNILIREGVTDTARVRVFESDDSGNAEIEFALSITQSTLTVNFSADHKLIDPGQSVTLKWNTQDATSGVLTMPGNTPDTMILNSTNLSRGEQSVTPIQDTIYSLTCKGRDPDVTRELHIGVRALKINSFSSSANAFSAADTITLSWQTEYASECAISTREGSGNVKVPALNNQTASCKVRATPDGTTLILSKSDGTGELGRLTLPTPSPTSITFLFTAGGSPNPLQGEWVVDLVRVQINYLDRNEQEGRDQRGTRTGIVYRIRWGVSSAGSVQVLHNGNQISTQASGTYLTDPVRIPEGPGHITVTGTGFGGPLSKKDD